MNSGIFSKPIYAGGHGSWMYQTTRKARFTHRPVKQNLEIRKYRVNRAAPPFSLLKCVKFGRFRVMEINSINKAIFLKSKTTMKVWLKLEGVKHAE